MRIPFYRASAAAWLGAVVLFQWLGWGFARADDLRLVSSWPGTLRGIPFDVVLQSGKAYLAMDTAGLAIFDLADPSNPRRVGELVLPSGFAPRQVRVDGTRAVTLDLGGTLTGIDISDPTRPRRLASTNRVLYTQSLDLRDGVVVCHAWDAARQKPTLEAWDLFREEGAVPLAVVDVPNDVGSCAFGGSRVLVGVGATKSYAYDVSDWANPVLAGTAAAGQLTYRLSSQGNLVLLDSGRLTVLNFDPPTLPTVIKAEGSTNYLSRTTWAGSIIWALGDGQLFRFVPGNSGPLGESFPLDDRLRSANLFAGDGNLLLIGTSSGEIQIYSVDSTSAPVLRGAISSFGDVSRVQVAGGYAYVAEGNGTRLLDVSDPGQPKSVAFLPAEEAMTARTDLDLRGSQLLTVESEYRGLISIWTNSPPDAPVLVREISFQSVFLPDSEPRLVRWVSDAAFFVAGRNRVMEFVRDAARGWILRSSQLLGVKNVTGIAFDGSQTLYFVGWTGVQSYPFGSGSPQPVLALPAVARGIAAAGAYACVACDTAGLVVVQTTDPTALRVVGSVATTAPAIGVAVRWPYVFVATGGSGIEVFEATDVAHPRRIAIFDTPGYAQAIELDGNRVYVADGPAGVTVLEFQPTRKSQEITLPPLFDRDYQGPAFRIPVTSSSGLPVSLKVVSGPATFTGDLCRSTGRAGAVFIRAEQPGNDEYAPAVVEGRFDFPFLRQDLIRTWMTRFYPACPQSLASRTGDPDGDGFTNEAEHALGTDPMVANADRRLPLPHLDGDGAQRSVVLELPVQPDPVVAVDWTKLLSYTTDLGSSQRLPVPSAWLSPQWDRVVVRIPLTAAPEIGAIDARFLRMNSL